MTPGDSASQSSVIRVSVVPGAMALTRTPSAPQATVAHSVRLLTPVPAVARTAAT